MNTYTITNKLGASFEVKVDAADAAEYERFTWHIHCGYAARNTTAAEGNQHRAQLWHRQVLGLVPCAASETKVDHINGDKRDNRRANLRMCTSAENARNRPMQANNRSGVKGVCWCKLSRRWIAHIGVGVPGRNRHIGRFVNLDDAIRARRAAARALHGEFLHSSERA